MYRIAELRRLAEIYLKATGLTADTLSTRIASRRNNRLIGRLLDGRGISGRSIERASDFFDKTWPENVAWPDDVARNGAEHTKEAAE